MLDDSPTAAEMRALLQTIAALSDKVSLDLGGQDARQPSFVIARDVKETLRKLKAAQYTAANPGQVCPAKWNEGAKTIAPSLELVGKI